MKPLQPLAQQTMFSHYKNQNSMKVVVGARPGWLVTYVSSAYCVIFISILTFKMQNFEY